MKSNGKQWHVLVAELGGFPGSQGRARCLATYVMNPKNMGPATS